MTKLLLLDVRLTIAEAKAMSRLIEAGIAQIEADPTQVSNEATLRRACVDDRLDARGI